MADRKPKRAAGEGEKIAITWFKGKRKPRQLNIHSLAPVVFMFMGVLAVASLGIWLIPENQLFWNFMTAVTMALFGLGREIIARVSSSKPKGPTRPS